MPARRTAPILFALLLLASTAPAEAQRSSLPVLGRPTELTLEDGQRIRGELIEATDLGLLLDGASGLELTELARVDRIRVRRHDFTGRKVLTWIGVGALVSGAGMTIACSQVEDTSCGGVFPGIAISFGLIGGLLGAGISSSGWRELSLEPDVIRPYARFPQGAPPGFASTRP